MPLLFLFFSGVPVVCLRFPNSSTVRDLGGYGLVLAFMGGGSYRGRWGGSGCGRGGGVVAVWLPYCRGEDQTVHAAGGEGNYIFFLLRCGTGSYRCGSWGSNCSSRSLFRYCRLGSFLSTRSGMGYCTDVSVRVGREWPVFLRALPVGMRRLSSGWARYPLEGFLGISNGVLLFLIRSGG